MSNLDEKLNEFYSKIHPAFRKHKAQSTIETVNIPTRQNRLCDTLKRQDQTPSFLEDSIKRARLLAQSKDKKSIITNMYGQFCPINGFKIDDVYPVSDGMVHKISEAKFIDVECYPNPLLYNYNPSVPQGNPYYPGNGSYGAKLLSKMGWAEGDCLGKDRNRVAEELELKIKTDRKGLAFEHEAIPSKAVSKHKIEIGNKNPISILMEYCQKNKLPAPIFTEIEATGPSNNMEFRISVNVLDKTYLSAEVFKTKKEARAASAFVAVIDLNL